MRRPRSLRFLIHLVNCDTDTAATLLRLFSWLLLPKKAYSKLSDWSYSGIFATVSFSGLYRPTLYASSRALGYSPLLPHTLLSSKCEVVWNLAQFLKALSLPLQAVFSVDAACVIVRRPFSPSRPWKFDLTLILHHREHFVAGWPLSLEEHHLLIPCFSLLRESSQLTLGTL